MSWEMAPQFDAAFRAAFANGKNVISVCPPAWWTTLPLFRQIAASQDTGIRNVVLIPDGSGLQEGVSSISSVEHCRPVLGATGLTRTGQLLRTRRLTTLVSTPVNMLKLLSRSCVDQDEIDRFIICWPEMQVDPGAVAMLDTILAECRGAQRMVITEDCAANTGFLERHAYRAPIAVTEPLEWEPSGNARYTVTDFLRIPEALVAALDILNPRTALVWDPIPEQNRAGIHVAQQPGVTVSDDPASGQVDLAVALEPPTHEVYTSLAENAGNVLLLIRAFQLPYARALVKSAKPLRLPSESDRARDMASRLRDQIRKDIQSQTLVDGLLALGPLYDEHDPATVAAALASRLSLPEGPEGEETELPAWVRIRIESGKRHRIRTGDVVGALLNAVGVPKNRVGKVEVRDGYSLVEVRAESADVAVKGLNGLMLRGNKLAARLDRH